MKILNLGILAHVDAGKTTLTERLLYAAGVIDAPGSVDDGSTQTDTLALERQRGITIKSAVVSFEINGVNVNLIDTPGHPDFIAEVERVLNVLDGAVLVVSAVEGVQAQTRVLMRALQRLRIPTLIFINKVDRGGADDERALAAIRARLTPAIVPMVSVHEQGTRQATVRPCAGSDAAFRATLAEALSANDDQILAAYVDGETNIPYRRLRAALAAQSRRGLVHPVFAGSAITGAGVDALFAAIPALLPDAEGVANGPVSGAVFKVERGAAGEKLAYVRMYSGSVRVRERLTFAREREERVTAISVFDRGSAVSCAALCAGQIGKLSGLNEVQIGDTIGHPRVGATSPSFATPTLETVVVPCRSTERGALHTALGQLAEQDPLINLRQDDARQEISVSLYGEVQKEVIQATLATEYGLQVEFRETTTICVERPAGVGEAFEIISKRPNPFLATVGLRIEPAEHGSGARFELGREVLGTMPLAFFKAVEDTVQETLRQGMHGWQVTDCLVTMTHSGYYPRQSHAHQRFSKAMSSTGEDFRKLTPLVLMAALKQARTVVHEPIHRFRLEIPADASGMTVSALARLQAIPGTNEQRGPVCVLEGHVPAARVHDLERELPGLSRGEGVIESAFDHYRPVRGEIPTRSRSDHNPLNRKEYLLHVQRRV